MNAVLDIGLHLVTIVYLIAQCLWVKWHLKRIYSRDTWRAQ